jgi:indole-3-glycerol phosphate synthase
MKTDFLSRIIETKRAALEGARRAIPLEQISQEAVSVRSSCLPHVLSQALSNGRINVIAEFKRTSPSKGLIRDDVTPEQMARYYESGGASGVSVLTEEHYFNGSLDDLRAIRAAVSLPVLRKDFIFDEYQVYETAAAGADALLLIVAALDDDALIRLRRLAEDELGMDALVEVHTKAEMKQAVACGAKLIGVNNRNLKTFEVSRATSRELAREPAGDALLVSESGLNSFHDLLELQQLGYKGFLIGERLMRAERPEETLRKLTRDYQKHAGRRKW